jgi:hypothetical protein
MSAAPGPARPVRVSDRDDCRIPPLGLRALNSGRVCYDKGNMSHNMLTLAIALLAGMGLCLYILRRRTRLGRRTPKF